MVLARKENKQHQRRRWYHQSLWTLLVPKYARHQQLSWQRLFVAGMLCVTAVVPIVMFWQSENHAVLWLFGSAATSCTLLGAGLGTLRAGWHGTLAGALIAAGYFLLASAALLLFAVVAVQH